MPGFLVLLSLAGCWESPEIVPQDWWQQGDEVILGEDVIGEHRRLYRDGDALKSTMVQNRIGWVLLVFTIAMLLLLSVTMAMSKDRIPGVVITIVMCVFAGVTARFMGDQWVTVDDRGVLIETGQFYNLRIVRETIARETIDVVEVREGMGVRGEDHAKVLFVVVEADGEEHRLFPLGFRTMAPKDRPAQRDAAERLAEVVRDVLGWP